MDFKAFPTEFKVDAEKRRIEGYASVFGNIDAYYDVVEPGAFAKTIRERMPKRLIKVLRQHHQPIGLPETLEEDDKGLFTVSTISKTALGDETLVLAQDGVLDRQSIGYDVVKADWRLQAGVEVRALKELKLYEYGPVLFAANEEAVITGVKSVEELERFLGLTPAIVEFMKAHPRLDPERFPSLSKKAELLRQAADLMETALQKSRQPDSSTADPTEPPSQTGDPDLQSLLQNMTAFARTIAA